MKKNPLNVALWRFDQISLFLDKRLTPGERARMIDEASRIEVIWPNGDLGPVPRSTLYRWLRAYQQTYIPPDIPPISDQCIQQALYLRDVRLFHIVTTDCYHR